MAWHLQGQVPEESRIISLREDGWGIDVNSNIVVQPNTPFDIVVNTNAPRTVAAINSEGKVDVYGNVTPVGYAKPLPDGTFTNYIVAADEDGLVACTGVPNDATGFYTYLDYPVAGDDVVGYVLSNYGSWFFFRNIQVAPGQQISTMKLQFDCSSSIGHAGETVSAKIYAAWRDDVRLPANLTDWSAIPWHPGGAWSWDITIQDSGVMDSISQVRDVAQYIIDRPGWNIGNTLMFCITPQTAGSAGVAQRWTSYERAMPDYPATRPRLIYTV